MYLNLKTNFFTQPPSGGCVLKLAVGDGLVCVGFPAAFGRLCVETNYIALKSYLVGTSRLRAAVC